MTCVDLIINTLKDKIPEIFDLYSTDEVRDSLIDYINNIKFRSDIVINKDDSTYLKFIKKLIVRHHKFQRKPKVIKCKPEYIAPSEKRCSKCLQLKPINLFNKNGIRHKAHCSKCEYVLYQRPAALKRLKKLGKVPKSEQKVMTDEEKRNARILKSMSPRYRIAKNLRTRVSKAIRRRGSSNKVSIKDVGCTKTELVQYIESQFKDGMTWENYGEWELDHIRPLASFDLTNSDELKIAANYKNLAPMWRQDNQRKSSNWNGVKYVKGKPIGDG